MDMEATAIAATSTDPSETIHHLPTSAGDFDLLREIDELCRSPQYKSTGHAARTLIKRPELSVVLVALGQGRDLKEHKVSGPVSIQTLIGRTRIESASGNVDQIEGGLMVLEPGLLHEVRALSACAFLLSIP